MFEHIKSNAGSKGIYLDSINGHLDHVHCLISMDSEISISKMVQLLKGESSFWANQEKLVKPKLEWAKDYYAISISDSAVLKVRNYIRNQDDKHGQVTFQDNYQQFIKDYEF